MKKVILMILLAGCWASQLQAQSPWVSDSRLSSVSVEWDKPLFDDRYTDRGDLKGATSALFFTGRLRATDNLRIVAELPVSYLGYKRNNPFGNEDNSTVIGNIYLGGIWDFNLDNPDNRAFVEGGVRIPTTPSPSDKRFGANTGMVSEASDRLEAFMWDTWAIPVIGNYVAKIDGPFAVKARLGTVYDLFVDDLKDNDNSLWLLYGITALYREPSVEAQLGFSGRNQYVGNLSGVNFWDSGFTQLRGGVAFPFRNVVPGIYVRKPLGDNYNSLMDFAYGFSLEFRR